MAILVSGPVGTSVISPSDAISVSMIYSTACLSSAFFLRGANTGPSSPVSPCMSSAITCLSRIIGCPHPAYTGISSPRYWHTFNALAVVFSNVWFPATTVMPNKSICGLLAASIMATASSWPGSQSKIILRLSIS